MKNKCKLKKDDEVIVLTGKDKGKTGTIQKVLPEERRVIVGGVNMVKRHERAGVNGQGGIITKEAAMHISNVALLDAKSGKGTRVGYTTDANGKKQRVARRSGETINA